MKQGLAALTKFVKVVMSYRPDRKPPAKPARKPRIGSDRKSPAGKRLRDK